MAIAHQLLTNLTAGELSPRLAARVDISKYRNGLKTLENGIVMPHGGIRKRPGTMFVSEVKNSANAVRLVPFEFSVTQAYVLEFGPSYIRIYRDGGRVESGGSPVEVATSYTAAQIFDLSFAQSADTLYIAHQEHPIATLTRTSDTSWTLADAEISGGPFKLINADETHYLGVAVTGSVSVSGATKANPVVVTTSSAHGLSDGACVTFASVGGMTDINGNKYIARNVTSTTLELWTIAETPVNGTGFGTYTSGGTMSVTTTTFGTISPGSTITLTSTDAMFSTSSVGQLYRLWEPGKATGIAAPVEGKNASNNDQYTIDGKVYGVTNASGFTNWQADFNYPNHELGVIRVADTSGGQFFDAVYLHDISCIVEVTAYSSSTSVTAKVVRNHIPKSILTYDTSRWEEGAWSPDDGYPSQITLHESRLWAAGSATEPQKVWASRTGQFLDFLDGVDDNAALVYEIASSKVDVVQWLSPGKVLAVGTANGEYAVSASSRNEALTPANVRIQRQTPYGVADTHPVQVANATLFIQRWGNPDNPGRRLREFTYLFENDSFVAPDLTIISEHITGDGIDNLVYQQSPDSVLWTTREDGQLAALTYEREQEVTGWHRHIIAGTGMDVESLAVIPGDDGDEVWLAVKRTINGTTKRYIELMTQGLQTGDDLMDAVYVDSALQYSGASTTTITGLSHLEGESVTVLGDDFVQGPYTVASGSITLAQAVEVATVGLAYTMVVETLELEAGAQAGSARGQRKRINDVFFEVYRSMGGTFGRDAANQDAILYRTTDDPMGQLPGLKSGLIKAGFDSGWSDDPRVRIEHADPLPFTLLALVAEMETSG